MPSLQHERQANAAPATDSGRLPGQVAIRVPRVRGSGKTLRKYSEVVALLMKRPRCIPELYEGLGIAYSSNSVQTLIHALRAEGLVYITDWVKYQGCRRVPVFAWQPSVCAYVDAAKPERRSMEKRQVETCDVACTVASKAVGIDE